MRSCCCKFAMFRNFFFCSLSNVSNLVRECRLSIRFDSALDDPTAALRFLQLTLAQDCAFSWRPFRRVSSNEPAGLQCYNAAVISPNFQTGRRKARELRGSLTSDSDASMISGGVCSAPRTSSRAPRKWLVQPRLLPNFVHPDPFCNCALRNPC